MCAARFDMQNRRLDFDVVALAQSAAKTRDCCVSHFEHATSLVVDDEVGVPLAISRVYISQAVKLVGQRSQRF